ncbi:MAG TPA: hypothetical protein VF538_16960 [Pyrinomonadaceae bacterium]|jgi:hypothetical protein
MTYRVEQKQWLAVLGGATRYGNEQVITAFKVGREIARKGKNLVTGGTTGIPYAAAMGAKQEGALVVGISPAASFEEHLIRYKKPLDYADFIVYTGTGVAGRSSILLQSVPGAVFIGGEFGTLNEFSAAWMCGNNVLGVLLGTGGVSERFQDILSDIETTWGSKAIFDLDPIELVHKVCEEVDQMYSTRSSQLQADEIGRDVRNIIGQFLDEESERSCVKQSATIPIGVPSTINLL